MQKALAVIGVWLMSVGLAMGQVIPAEKFLLTTGPCVIHSGSGTPATNLGAVCDVYIRTDVYTIYSKTAPTTWSEIYRAGGTDVAVADGGTGLSAWTTGDLLLATSATTLTGLPDVGAGAALVSNAGVPGWTVSPILTGSLTAQTSLSSPTLTHSANLSVSPQGNVVLGPVGQRILPNVGYTQDLGMLTNKYRSLYAAELWVETLVAQNTLATIGGRVLVGPTTTLLSDLASGDTTIHVKHNQLANGDRVVLEADGSVEWMAITSSAFTGPPNTAPSAGLFGPVGAVGPGLPGLFTGSGSSGTGYYYTVTRDLDLSGANNWAAGDAVFNTGAANDGYIDLYSVRGLIQGSTVGPTIVGNVRTGAAYDAVSPRWAIGNLNGIYGYSSDTYGTAFGDYSNSYLTIDAANGIRMIGDAGTMFSMDTAGNATFRGSILVGMGGRNRITNSEMRTTWVSGSNTYGANTDGVNYSTGAAPGFHWGQAGLGGDTGLTPSWGCQLASWYVNGSGSCYFTLTGTPAINTFSFLYGPAFTVTAGQRYEWSFYCGSHRGSFARADIWWYDINGATIGGGSAGSQGCVNGASYGGTQWSGWGRTGVIADAPTGAVRALLIIVQQYPGASGWCSPSCADPYLFYTRLYFGEAQANQTELSPWSAAGITQIDGSHLATNLVLTTSLIVTDGAWGAGNQVAGITGVDGDTRIWAGDTFANRASAEFRVTEAGALTATNATITGTVTASAGAIGGWTIGATTLSATNVSLTSGGANAANITVGTGATAGGLNSANAGGDVAFWAGATHTNRGAAPFRVEADGSLVATDIDITGGSVRWTSSGIVMTPGSAQTWSGGQSYRFDVTNGNLGLYGWTYADGSNNRFRGMWLQSKYTTDGGAVDTSSVHLIAETLDSADPIYTSLHVGSDNNGGSDVTINTEDDGGRLTVYGYLNLMVGGATTASGGSATLPGNPCGFITIYYSNNSYRVPVYGPGGGSCP